MLGTHKDNRLDCVTKGRNNSPKGDYHNYRRYPECRPYGSRNARAVLNERQVRRIKQRIKRGDRGVDIAHDYGVTKHVVWSIKTGHTWGHI